jgi:hypothetical protein
MGERTARCTDVKQQTTFEKVSCMKPPRQWQWCSHYNWQGCGGCCELTAWYKARQFTYRATLWQATYQLLLIRITVFCCASRESR